MAELTSNLTFGIIKPDAVRAGNTGQIIQRISAMPFAFRDMARSIEFYLVIRSPRKPRRMVLHLF